MIWKRAKSTPKLCNINSYSLTSTRFKDTNYAVLSALRCMKQTPHWVDLIYDIACKYHKNLKTCMLSYDADLVLDNFDEIEWRFLIPKFHIGSHGLKCQTRFSLNWVRGCGRTFGEMIEQEWSHIKRCGPMTREQGPSAWHLTLDNQWSGWNWRCMLGLGK
jgi:hypothetical protein